MNLYEQLSDERKTMQENGVAPEWMSTAGWQLFKSKYLYKADNPKEQFEHIARTAAKHMHTTPSWWPEERTWYDAFYEILWKGWKGCSTPVLSNMGSPERGCPVSCAQNVVDDSVLGFYDAYREVAVLSKASFGTASDLSGIRPRGSLVSTGGKSSGVVPVFDHFVRDMKDIVQGTRRGAWAGYLDIEHGDFWELLAYVEKAPDGANVGWTVHDSFIAKLNAGDEEATNRFQQALKVKMITGRGYFFKIDEVNRHRPKVYKDLDLKITSSQLCNEIVLHSSKDLTYSCVLGWLNLSKADEWIETDAVFVATCFLDAVVSEFLQIAKDIPGMEKIVAMTAKGRAIGLGVAGFHTYLQEHDMEFGGFEAHMWNNKIFKHIHDQSLEASKWLAEYYGEPEWLKGYGERFTHRTAIAPTKSSALIYGGISEGISPDIAMCYTQISAGGEVERINPSLLKLIKKKGLDIDKCTSDMVKSQGSVQDVSWLTEDEKKVFKTAFEIRQEDILRLAGTRKKYVCQWMSLNLYFPGNATEEDIASIHQQAFLDPNILGLYYIYSSRQVVSSSGECAACM